ncbi:MAG TPA: PP2C family protein-serine/threonine phosphatase [Thermoanaerobaculia bacterium]|nr:PP2C family protein-serine/threonine phosphatase [Thermoanaerobaculia bacterium]
MPGDLIAEAPVPGAWIAAALTTLPPDLRLQLRADLPAVAIGIGILTLSLAAGSLAVLRHRAGDRALLYLSLLAAGYGARLLAATSAAELVFGLPPGALIYFLTTVSYLLVVPAILFFQQLLGRGWHSIIARWWQLSLAFALCAIAYEGWRRSPWAASRINSLLVIVGIGIVVLHLYVPGPTPAADLRPLRISFLVLGIFVVGENLRSLGLRVWPHGVEPIGFVLFLGGLGSIVARRFFTTQASLGAIQQELATARQIQTSILPRRLPEVRGLDLAVRYLPAAAVAGDFYDFLPGGERALGVLVADVAGHGVPAALIASMVKVAAVAQAAHAASPGRVLTEMNRIFHGQLQRHFVTAVYVYLDLSASPAAPGAPAAPGGARLTYGSAGHPPPLLVRGDGGARRAQPTRHTVGELRQGGPVLGRLSRAPHGEASVALALGDSVVLYTDGLLEARGEAGEPFGEARLQAFLAGHGGLAAEPLAAALLDELSRWSGRGGGFEDDVTLVVLQVAGD